jgi:hypothetical protein
MEENNIIASEGKTFARKDDGTVLGTRLWLGKNDSAENYIEVDIPPPVEEEKQSDLPGFFKH